VQLYELSFTRSIRARWTLQELGVDFEAISVNLFAGEAQRPEFLQLNPAAKIPVLVDGDFVLTESAAIVLYLAEKAGKLHADDLRARTRVTQWCFAAVATLAPTFIAMDLAGMFDPDKAALQLHAQLPKLAGRWLAHLDRQLGSREWIAAGEFTVADLLLACVLRSVRKTDLMLPHPAVKAFYDRCMARPAWQRTLALYAARTGAGLEAIR
jgi:glutathione S-transferase